MEICSVTFKVEPSLVREFQSLLQAGFRMRCRTGITVENLLLHQFHLEPRLIEEKITTIFLDGKPVDDIGTTLVHEDSVLALSGAMPGLVGATLRRKSPLASFRQSISARENHEDGSREGEGYVQIKLFNILLSELGPIFLAMGILLDSTLVTSFLEEHSLLFWNGCREILVNDIPVDAGTKWYSSEACQGFVELKVLVHP